MRASCSFEACSTGSTPTEQRWTEEGLLARCVQATAETFLDGLMQTGDVFEQRGPNRIIWTDRKNNVMKLSQVWQMRLSPHPLQA